MKRLVVLGLLALSACDAEADPPFAEACRSNDPDQICLALKYVVYRDSAGVPVENASEADAIVARISGLWAQCKIKFFVEEFSAVNPATYGLRYQTANYPELTQIRSTFQNNHTLLIVTTGPWDRSGTLGNTGANAWTSLPGSNPYGTVLERTVSDNSNLIAHELGHYLNLLHVSDANELMNPVIYGRSVGLTGAQCAEARSAAQSSWYKMLRSGSG